MHINAIDHTAVNVSNVEKSRAFYTNGLGLTEIDRPDFDFGGVWYGIGKDQQFHLIAQSDLEPAKKRMNHHFAFRVVDVEATKKELQARGVPIVAENVRPDGITQVFVADPDGYIIEFSNNR